MLQRGERKAGARRRRTIPTAAQRVEHARRERIAAADPVDDPGQHDLFGLT